MRLAPRPRTALVVFALYLLVFYGVWQLTGVAYNDVGDSARTIAKWYVAPLAAGAVVLAMLVHGFWDFASFIGDGGGAVASLVLFSNGVLGLCLVLVLLRREKGVRTPQVGVDAPEVAPAAVT